MSGTGEANQNKAVRRTRRDAREEPVETVGYVDETGEEKALTGDEHAPYVYALARATTDGEAVNEADKGEPQFLLCDADGKLYVISTPSSTAVQMVEGDIAHDAIDSNVLNFPVKIGGRAIDVEAAMVAAVAEGDRVNALFDLFGRLGMLPFPLVEEAQELVASGEIPDGVVSTTTIIDVRHWRRIAYYYRYTAGIAGADLQMSFLGSAAAAMPASAATMFQMLAINDGSPAATDNAREDILRNNILRTAVADADPDEFANPIVFDVTHLRWFTMVYFENNAGVGDEGTLAVDYNRAL